MSKTKIEWAEESWNPVTGCTKVSPGCKNCYAEKMSKRLAGRFGYPAADPFSVTLHPDKITEPLSWKKPQKIFVCSMGDLFHDDVLDRWIAEVFKIIGMCWAAKDGRKNHIFMILTKRPERLRNFFRDWPLLENLPNVWLGVTAENQEQADVRIPMLLSIPAVKRFVSIEPMLGPVELDNIECKPGYFENALSLEEWAGAEDSPEVKASMGGGALLDWVICGGESGPGARPIHPDWVRGVRDQCDAYGVPFFFKQWGEWATSAAFCEAHQPPKKRIKPAWLREDGVVRVSCMPYSSDVPKEGSQHKWIKCAKIGKKDAGRMLDGKEYLEWPR